MCRKRRIIPVEFDAKNDARFDALNEEGKQHIDYVRYYPSFEDLPLDKMLNARKEAVGERYELWNEDVLQGRQAEN